MSCRIENTLGSKPIHGLDGVECRYIVVETLPEHTLGLVQSWQLAYMSLWQHMLMFSSMTGGPWMDHWTKAEVPESDTQHRHVGPCAGSSVPEGAKVEKVNNQTGRTEDALHQKWSEKQAWQKVRGRGKPSTTQLGQQSPSLSGHRFFKAANFFNPKDDSCSGEGSSYTAGDRKDNSCAGGDSTYNSKVARDKKGTPRAGEDFDKAIAEHEGIMACSHEKVPKEEAPKEEAPKLPEDETETDAQRQCCGIQELRNIGTGSSACPRLRVNVSALARSQWYSAEEACTLLDMFSEWLDRAFIIQEYQGMIFGLRPDGDAFTAFWHFMSEHRQKDGLCKRLSTPYHRADQVYVPEQTAGWFKLQPDVQQLITTLHDDVAAEQPPLDHSKWMAYSVPANTGRGGFSGWAGPQGLSPGVLVRLHGLKAKPELNGLTGSCVAFDKGKGRWQVRVEDHTRGDMLFKEENLQAVGVEEYEAAQAAAEGQDDFSCDSGDHSQDSDSAMEDYLEQMGVDVGTTDLHSTPVTDHKGKGKGKGKFKSRPPGSERALQSS